MCVCYMSLKHVEQNGVEEEEGTTDDFAVFALEGKSVSSSQVLLIHPRGGSANENKLSENQGRGTHEST